jgi:LmbE family N-acetylglucosaminyl deacetylase
MTEGKIYMRTSQSRLSYAAFPACVLTLLLLIQSIAPSVSSRADVAGGIAKDAGAVRLAEAIKRLGTIASVLHTGAHPDDEDSGLLAYLARGRQARTAYLSLTRGDGGQNIIGPELYDALGVIRTEELLAARSLDGAEQYFTRAYDFGFSKSRKEALSKWDADKVIGDIARVIRTMKPLVVISAWSGTPNDQHGHHQAAGFLTREAVSAAADSARYPEQLKENLRPWKVRKFYIRAGGRLTQGRAFEPQAYTLSMNTGEFDPVLGRSYYEIAMEGRSKHRSQDQGALERRGPQWSRLRLIENNVGEVREEKDIFEGLDISINGIAAFASNPSDQLKQGLADVQRAADEAKSAYNPFDPSAVSPAIARGLKSLRDLIGSYSSMGVYAKEVEEIGYLLKRKEADFEQALALSQGIIVDVFANDEMVTPGQSFNLDVSAYSGPAARVEEISVLTGNFDWKITKGKQSEAKEQGRAVTHAEFKIDVSEAAKANGPYWLRNPRQGDMFDPGTLAGINPHDYPVVESRITFDILGQRVVVNQKAQYRYADKALGEVRRDLKIVPAVSVSLSPDVLIYPKSSTPIMREVTVTVTNNRKGGAQGAVALDPVRGWTISPAPQQFDLKREGETASFTFKITVPGNAPESRNYVSARATVNGRDYREGYQVISYPHIEPRLLAREARAAAEVIDVKVAPGLKIGYIEGAGDDFMNALGRIGADAQAIDARELAAGDLSKYDTIVLGVRVYEVRPDVMAYNARLLDYVKRGGTLIVQYNKNEYARDGFAPYKIMMSDRQPLLSAPQARATEGERPPRLMFIEDIQLPRMIKPEERAPTIGFIGRQDDQYTGALKQKGARVEFIDPSKLASGDLQGFDMIVTGTDAARSRSDLVQYNDRLIEYSRRAPLVLLYSAEQYRSGDFPSYPRIDSRPYRVTDENAVVSVLDPSHPRFNFPNRITERDFEGWVQERGAYFLSQWDNQFKPLMSSRDEGEEEKQGGELIVEYGAGRYVYTAYAWFRQLPNGVPGAYRLIANLVSLPKASSNHRKR